MAILEEMKLGWTTFWTAPARKREANRRKLRYENELRFVKHEHG